MMAAGGRNSGKRFAAYAASAVAASVALIAVSLSLVPALTTSALSQGEEKGWWHLSSTTTMTSGSRYGLRAT